MGFVGLTMRILFLEPYYGGSHRTFLDGLIRHSTHKIVPLTLPARDSPGRARSAALVLHEKLSGVDGEFDLVIASDHLNLAEFLALGRDRFLHTSRACYYHENRLRAAVAGNDPADFHEALNNLMGAAVSDVVFFTSDFHRHAFLQDLQAFVERMPDARPREETLLRIIERCQVLPLGLELAELDQWQHSLEYDSPTILWNHRWSEDKNPEMFFRALYQLAEEGYDFGVVISGEPYRGQAGIFEEARRVLGDRVFHYGYVATRGEYANLLWMADIVVSTAVQEFFGVSVAEAIFCNCYPILPRRLNYPNLLPPEHHDLHLYDDYEDLLRKLRHAITSPLDTRSLSLRHVVEPHDWRNLAPVYDRRLAEVVLSHEPLSPY